MPRVERITEMKWMQVFSSRGAELDLVSSYNKSQLGSFQHELPSLGKGA